jgi:RHS repeat-associated protein
VTETRYNDPLNQVTVTNPRGFKTRTRKDGLDRVAETVVDEGDTAQGRLNLTTQLTYDAAGNILTVQDPENGDIDLTHEYDQLGRRLLTTFARTPDDASNVVEKLAYDGVGNVIGSKDKRGFEHRASFDNLNRPLKRELKETISNGSQWLALSTTSYDDAGNSITVTDARGNGVTTENDELGRPRKITDALGRFQTMTYDGMNQRSQTDKKGQREEFTYDRLNRVRTTTEFDAAGQRQTTTQIEYFDSSRRRRVTDRRGLKTTSELDALGRLIRTERAGGDLSARYGADPLLLERREYDSNNNLVRLVDANGQVTEHGYDSADRRFRTIEGLGSSIAATNTFRFDRVGNLLEVKDGRGTNTFDLRHTYDARYRKVTTENALGETTQYHYDAVNNLTQLTEPLGYTTRYEYDELNALLAVDETLRNSGGDAGVTRFRYDENRNKTAQQDANSNPVTYFYDPLNRLIRTEQHTAPGTLGPGGNRRDPTGGGNPLVWRYDYDPNGNQNLIVDARGQRVDLSYDHLDRLTRRLYTNHVEQAAAGRPIDFQPIEITYAYDGNGNLTNCVERKQLGAGAITERTAATFDALDRLATKTRFDHDDPAGRILAFSYDAIGNRRQVTDPDGRVTRYSYDERNRLKTVVLDPGPTNAPNPAALTTTYEWEPDSLLKRIEFPGRAFAVRTYDPTDRVQAITNAIVTGALFSAFVYRYDSNGNRTNQLELQPALSPTPESTAYTYDKLNRLVRVTYGSGPSLTYTYAPNGNRLTERGQDPVTGQPVDRVFHYTAQSGKTNVTYNGVNALSRIEDRTPAARHIDYEYDANLNQTARVQAGVRLTFRFDVRDQIVAAQTTNGLVRFDYNNDRLRVKKFFGVDETRYLYDQTAVLLEYGPAASSHATQHKYDYGYELLALGTAQPGGALARDFYLTDALMSTANLITPAGALTHSYRYDAWGRLRAEQGASDNRRQYTGHYRDQETGLHYFGARYYDDEQGRFLSQDPYLGEANTPPSLHRYLYAYANPLRFVDLTGYSPDAADEWIKKTQAHLKRLDAMMAQDIEAVEKGGMQKVEKGRQAEIELQRMDAERQRMLAEVGLTAADLANPVMADRYKWGMQLLRRDLGAWVERGGEGWVRAVVAASVETAAIVGLSPFETGASAGTVSGKVAVGAQVSAMEWLGAGMDVAAMAGPMFKLGRMGAAAVAERAAQRAARQVVIAEARTTLKSAVGQAAKLIDDAPKRLAAEKEWLTISRQVDESMRELAAARKAQIAAEFRAWKQASDLPSRIDLTKGNFRRLDTDPEYMGSAWEVWTEGKYAYRVLRNDVIAWKENVRTGGALFEEVRRGHAFYNRLGLLKFHGTGLTTSGQPFVRMQLHEGFRFVPESALSPLDRHRVGFLNDLLQKIHRKAVGTDFEFQWGVNKLGELRIIDPPKFTKTEFEKVEKIMEEMVRAGHLTPTGKLHWLK